MGDADGDIHDADGDARDGHADGLKDRKKRRKRRKGKLRDSDIENADIKELEGDIDIEVHPKKGDKLQVPKMGKRPKGKKYTVMSVSGGSKKKRGKKEKDSDVLDRGYLDNPLAEKFDLSQPIDVDALMPTIKAYDQDEIQRQQKGADKGKRAGKRKKSRETAAEREGTAAAAAKISKRSKKERKK